MADQRMLLRRRISRRHFLGAGAAVAAAASLGFTCTPPPPSPPVAPRARATGPRHLSWVWQFTRDGPPEQIVSVLAQHNLGILLKTHDGTDWMRRYDDSFYAVTGRDQVAVLSSYFETYGVPFHAWCVVKGLDPHREAQMCAEVIAGGARSVTVDLEPHSGFWQGTPEAALAFGREFRMRQPAAPLYLSVDARPWVLERVPLREFAAFAQGFAPQLYWETFNTSGNVSRFVASGYPPGEAGVTPEFLLAAAYAVLGGYRLPISPAGQGASTNEAWTRFLARAVALEARPLSVWRHGVTSIDVLRLVSSVPPSPEAVLRPGVRAQVANTGTCLNVRESPTVRAATRTCLPDGTAVVILAGPQDADGYRWWQVEWQGTTGWSAEGEPGGVRWLVPVQ